MLYETHIPMLQYIPMIFSSSYTSHISAAGTGGTGGPPPPATGIGAPKGHTQQEEQWETHVQNPQGFVYLTKTVPHKALETLPSPYGFGAVEQLRKVLHLLCSLLMELLSNPGTIYIPLIGMCPCILFDWHHTLSIGLSLQ